MTIVMILGFLLAPASALGHGAGHGEHDERHVHWNFDPLIVTSLALATLAYGIGLAGLWRQAGIGRGVARWQAACFLAGIGVLVLALMSPVDPISDQLGSMHMIQHMLIMMVAAPLLVAGTPMIVVLRSLPLRWRSGLARMRRRIEKWVGWGRGWRSPWYLLWQPVLMWAVFAGVLWVWHLPRLYEAALHNERLHDLQHLAFLVTACLFWRVLVDPIHRLRLNMATATIYLFTASLHATLLGVFMALSPRVWYEAYIGRTQAWGLSALEDQQLAGLIMWMPACMLFALVAMIVCWLWLARDELREGRLARGAMPVEVSA